MVKVVYIHCAINHVCRDPAMTPWVSFLLVHTCQCELQTPAIWWLLWQSFKNGESWMKIWKSQSVREGPQVTSQRLCITARSRSIDLESLIIPRLKKAQLRQSTKSFTHCSSEVWRPRSSESQTIADSEAYRIWSYIFWICCILLEGGKENKERKQRRRSYYTMVICA